MIQHDVLPTDGHDLESPRPLVAFLACHALLRLEGSIKALHISLGTVIEHCCTETETLCGIHSPLQELSHLHQLNRGRGGRSGKQERPWEDGEPVEIT